MPVVPSHAWFSQKLKSYGMLSSSDQSVRISDGTSDYQGPVSTSALQEWVSTICSQILKTDAATVAGVAAKQVPRQVLLDLVARTADQVSTRAGFFRQDLQQQVMDFLFGYGPLQSYVENEKISDIDGIAPDAFTVKVAGVPKTIPVAFSDETAYDTFCRLLIIRNGGVINENDSHCRVTDERYRLRVNVTVPPRSVRYPTISIRKHPMKSWNLDDLVSMGMMNQSIAQKLAHWGKSNKTMLICGKGAAGKTTLLRAILETLPPLERVLIAESDSELYPEKSCCIIQKIKGKDQGGRPVTLADLVRDGLTMSLDTYCVGEIVGDEAMAFIEAAFSGHRCLATLHANSASDVPDRLLTLARPASSSEPDRTLRRMIGSSIDIIVSLEQFKVSEIMCMNGYREEDDRYEMAYDWKIQPDPTANTAAGQ
jgi:pilus assembly protein CpaF